MSKNELAGVRAWLLEAERYEDVVQFDRSDEAKERLYNELCGSDSVSYCGDSDTREYIERLKNQIETFKKLYNLTLSCNEGLNNDVRHLCGILKELHKERDELLDKLNNKNLL